MRHSWLISLAFLMVLQGCFWGKSPTIPVKPSESPVMAPVSQAATFASTTAEEALKSQGKAISKAVANIQTATKANEANPDGAPKATVKAELDLAQVNLASPADASELLAGERRARAIAEGKTDEARRLYEQATKEAINQAAEITRLKGELSSAQKALAATIAEADRRLEAERLERDAQYRAGIAAERAKAELASQRLITLIFFGGGAILLAAAGAIMFLAGYVPALGPRAAIAVAISGLLLIGIGMAIREAMQHPWIIWTGLGLCAATIAIAVGLIYANHHHDNTK